MVGEGDDCICGNPHTCSRVDEQLPALRPLFPRLRWIPDEAFPEEGESFPLGVFSWFHPSETTLGSSSHR